MLHPPLSAIPATGRLPRLDADEPKRRRCESEGVQQPSDHPHLPESSNSWPSLLPWRYRTELVTHARPLSCPGSLTSRDR